MTRIAFAALLLFTACATLANDVAAVRAQSSALARAAGNVEQSVAFFTPVAVVHLEGSDALRGRAEIGEMYRALFPPLVSFWNDIHEVRVSGELAYEIGTSHLITRDDELRTMGLKQWTRKYLAIWTRGKDGVWRIDALSITRNPS